MTYYLYAKDAQGNPDVTDYKLDLKYFPGYVYLGEHETPPDVSDKRYVSGQWVRASEEPEYQRSRRKAYPPITDLIRALWTAMDDGTLPKVAGFYDKIKAVHERFPKE